MLIAAYAASAAAATTNNTITARRWAAALFGGAVDGVQNLRHHQALLARYQHVGVIADGLDERADLRLMHLNVRQENRCRVNQRLVTFEEHAERARAATAFRTEELGIED